MEEKIDGQNRNNLDSNEYTSDGIDEAFQGSFEDFIGEKGNYSEFMQNRDGIQMASNVVDNGDSGVDSEIKLQYQKSSGKSLLNVWFLAWLITYIVLLIISKLGNGWIRMWQAVFLNILLFVFLIAWVVYLVKYNKFSEMSIGGILDTTENKLWRIVKNYYARIFVFALFFTIRMAIDNSWWHKFYNRFDGDYLGNRYYEIQNEYAGCNCFGPNATQSYELAESDYFVNNVSNKFEFEFLIETTIALLGGKNQYEIRNEMYNNVNLILGKKCFGDGYELCDLSNLSESDVEEIFSGAANMISPEKLQQWGLY